MKIGFVYCVAAGDMSFSDYPSDDPIALDAGEAGGEYWIERMFEATTESTESTANAYVPKYPGLQEFSRRYADIHGYIAAVVCIWGVIANLANIVVLTRRKMITPTNVILTWLAVADLLTMAIFLPFAVHFYVLRDRRLPFPSTLSAGWIRSGLFNLSQLALLIRVPVISVTNHCYIAYFVFS